MVHIKPFAALHPRSGNAKEIACFPYDVAYETEAREFVRANPNSFLRVTRPEADFSHHIDPLSDQVLQAAKQNLDRLKTIGLLVHDDSPSVYIYRLAAEGHSQTGVVACCSLSEYEDGTIRKHERTRPDKVADRTAHMVALRAQTGLILLAFLGTEATRAAIAEAVMQEPIFDFTDVNGLTHTVWNAANSGQLISAFRELPSLYIADGHHRMEAALNARNILRAQNGSETGNAKYDFVLSGMFPADELRILPYNRVVRSIGLLTDEELFSKIAESFVVTEADVALPDDQRIVKMYFRGKWYRLKFDLEYVQAPDPIEQLDVTILHKYLLEPIFGILDPRTDDRIGFVGGIRGTDELERIVDSGEAEIAFALHPTRMEDLIAVSDMGEIMPPKSTWFEPKLKDGLFVYQI